MGVSSRPPGYWLPPQSQSVHTPTRSTSLSLASVATTSSSACRGCTTTIPPSTGAVAPFHSPTGRRHRLLKAPTGAAIWRPSQGKTQPSAINLISSKRLRRAYERKQIEFACLVYPHELLTESEASLHSIDQDATIAQDSTALANNQHGPSTSSICSLQQRESAGDAVECDCESTVGRSVSPPSDADLASALMELNARPGTRHSSFPTHSTEMAGIHAKSRETKRGDSSRSVSSTSSGQPSAANLLSTAPELNLDAMSYNRSFPSHSTGVDENHAKNRLAKFGQSSRTRVDTSLSQPQLQLPSSLTTTYNSQYRIAPPFQCAHSTGESIAASHSHVCELCPSQSCAGSQSHSDRSHDSSSVSAAAVSPLFFHSARTSEPIHCANGLGDRAAHRCAIHTEAVSREPAALRACGGQIRSEGSSLLTLTQRQRSAGPSVQRVGGVNCGGGRRGYRPSPPFLPIRIIDQAVCNSASQLHLPGPGTRLRDERQPSFFRMGKREETREQLSALSARLPDQNLASSCRASLSVAEPARQPTSPPAGLNNGPEPIGFRMGVDEPMHDMKFKQPARCHRQDLESVTPLGLRAETAFSHSTGTAATPTNALHPTGFCISEHEHGCAQLSTSSIQRGDVNLDSSAGCSGLQFRASRQRCTSPSHRSATQQLCTLRIESMQKQAKSSSDSNMASVCEVSQVADSASVACKQRLLRQFRDVFPDQLPPVLPPRRDVDHRIELTPGAVPPSRPTYRLSATELAELRKQLAELTAAGFIQPSKSPFGAPILFVKKKDGS